MEDYKEKYEQALQRAKQFSEKPFLEDSKGIVEYIFPELAESVDECIRKSIIHLVKKSNEQGGYALHKDEADKMIAWLKKQSTPQVRTGLEWVNTIDDACDKRYSEEYAHGAYCHEQSFKWGFQEGVDWLEKQREQKAICRNNDTTIDGELNNYCCKIYNALHKENGGKLSFARLQNMAMDIYQWCNEQKQGEQNPISLEDAAKLFLEKLSESPYNNKPITDAQVITKELINFLKDTNTYNPNAINEQKPAWSEEDEENNKNILYILNQLKGTAIYKEDKTAENCIDWLKSIKDRYTWKPSELQIEALESATENCAYSEYQDCLRELIGQLKKLKE